MNFPKPSKELLKKNFLYIRLVFSLGMMIVIAPVIARLYEFFEHGHETDILKAFFVFSVVCLLGFIVHYLSIGTPIPSFVVAILFGMAAQPMLWPLTNRPGALSVIVGFCATLILFSGGLDTPWQNFKRLFPKIIILSFVGLGLTAWLFSTSLAGISGLLNQPLSVSVIVILGAILASTDPAAIIPILKSLRFKNRDTKDIIIAESALTDVTGSLLTIIFIGLVSAGVAFSGVTQSFGLLANVETGQVLLRQIFVGTVFGVLGSLLLIFLKRLKFRQEEESGVDAAYFFFVPVLIFTLSLALGGSGYLAAFVAGLLFVLNEHLHETEKFFNQTIDGFLKPTIFLLLGALVDLKSLWEYAALGITVALVFILIIRPISVLISLSPFLALGKYRLRLNDIFFIASIRETGAIPAVLLVTLASLHLPNMDGLISIGMWVILGTLVLAPPLTPAIASYLDIAEPIEDKDELRLLNTEESTVVLGSRGRSFISRLGVVADWASQHKIKNIILLHCLENDYSPELAEEIGQVAKEEFARINEDRKKSGLRALTFGYVSRTGFLQKNIDDLARSHKNVAAIFVGRKILDYRLSEIKDLNVPLFFID